MRGMRCKYRDCGRERTARKHSSPIRSLNPVTVPLGDTTRARAVDLRPRSYDDAIRRRTNAFSDSFLLKTVVQSRFSPVSVPPAGLIFRLYSIGRVHDVECRGTECAHDYEPPSGHTKIT